METFHASNKITARSSQPNYQASDPDPGRSFRPILKQLLPQNWATEGKKTLVSIEART